MSSAPLFTSQAAEGWQESRTLVIGSGFIGSHVATQVAGGGTPPVVLTRTRPSDEIVCAIGEENLHLGDAGDVDTVKDALEGVDRIAFCAGGLLPAASEEDPELDRHLTLRPLRSVLTALRERPRVRFVYLSSGGTVYGEPDEVPVSESAPTRPLGAYGRLHLACETEVMRERDRHGFNARILRCSTVYGEHQQPDRGQGAIVTFLHRIARGDPIDLYGGGSTIRDYIYAGDVARTVVALLGREDGPAILNVGAGRGTALRDILRLAERQVGRTAQIVQHDARDFEIHQIVLDTKRLRQLVDLELTPLETGIAQTHKWLSTVTPKVA